VFCLAASGFAARDAFVAWKLRPVRAVLSDWDRAGYVEDGPRWQQNWAQVAGLTARDGANPESLFVAGRMREWRAEQQRTSPIDSAQQARAAATLFSDVLAIRPTWDNAWWHLARSRWFDDSDNAAFSFALSGALRVARYEPRPERDLGWLVINGWSRLDAETQAAGKVYLARIARDARGRAWLRETAGRARRLDLLDAVAPTPVGGPR